MPSGQGAPVLLVHQAGVLQHQVRAGQRRGLVEERERVRHVVDHVERQHHVERAGPGLQAVEETLAELDVETHPLGRTAGLGQAPLAGLETGHPGTHPGGAQGDGALGAADVEDLLVRQRHHQRVAQRRRHPADAVVGLVGALLLGLVREPVPLAAQLLGVVASELGEVPARDRRDLAVHAGVGAEVLVGGLRLVEEQAEVLVDLGEVGRAERLLPQLLVVATLGVAGVVRLGQHPAAAALQQHRPRGAQHHHVTGGVDQVVQELGLAEPGRLAPPLDPVQQVVVHDVVVTGRDVSRLLDLVGEVDLGLRGVLARESLDVAGLPGGRGADDQTHAPDSTGRSAVGEHPGRRVASGGSRGRVEAPRVSIRSARSPRRTPCAAVPRDPA